MSVHGDRAICLHITNAGLAAIGVEPDGGDSAHTGADEAPSAEAPQDASAEADPAPKARTPRKGTKQAKLIEMCCQTNANQSHQWQDG